MDLDLVRTFLEIMRQGSFVAAARNLNISQTAVTARVRNLEELVNCKLFIRSRAGIQLTLEGRIFASYASESLQAWDKLQRSITTIDAEKESLFIGSETALQSSLLLAWCFKLRASLPHVKLSVSSGRTEELYDRVSEGSLNAALVYRADYAYDMPIRQVMEEKLILVEAPGASNDYVFVNWGDEFFEKHLQSFPGLIDEAVVFDHGPLALDYLLQRGGRGYFRYGVVKQMLADDTLTLVQDAPEFSYPVYIVYQAGTGQSLIHTATDLLFDLDLEKSSAGTSQQ
ncbi:MAG: LysR family transcriptional regulator [Pseudomonadales bacterium]|nr:LysR family transcriptional regulator [Pseudomonadales bacterium]